VTKYTCCCLTSVVVLGCSTVKTILTTMSVAVMYNSSTLPGFGGISVGRDFRYYLSLMKVDAA
jgi:uncharacterized protein YcfL